MLLAFGDRGRQMLGGLLVDLLEGLVQGLAVFRGELAGFADEGMDQFLEAIEGLELSLTVGGEGGGEVGGTGRSFRRGDRLGQNAEQEAVFVAEMTEERNFIDFGSFRDRFSRGGGDALVDEQL